MRIGWFCGSEMALCEADGTPRVEDGVSAGCGRTLPSARRSGAAAAIEEMVRHYDELDPACDFRSLSKNRYKPKA